MRSLTEEEKTEDKYKKNADLIQQTLLLSGKTDMSNKTMNRLSNRVFRLLEYGCTIEEMKLHTNDMIESIFRKEEINLYEHSKFIHLD